MAEEDPTSNNNKRGIPQGSKLYSLQSQFQKKIQLEKEQKLRLLQVQNGNKSKENLVQARNPPAAGVAGASSATLKETVSSNSKPVQAQGTRNGISVSTPQSSNGNASNANSHNSGASAMIRNKIRLQKVNVTPSNHTLATSTGSTKRVENMNHTDSAGAPTTIYQAQSSIKSKPVQSAKVSNKQTIHVQAPKQQVLLSSLSPLPSPTLTPTSSVTVPTTPINAIATPTAAVSTSKATNKTFTKPTPTIPTITKPKAKVTRSGPPPDGTVECSQCGRYFLEERIAKHEGICRKAAQKKRKVFLPTIMRLRGTEAEPYMKKVLIEKAKSKGPNSSSSANSSNGGGGKSWRKTHEDFINTIRAAREYKEHIAKGGNPKDLPPPPKSDYSDYVKCPTCGRKFNAGAAQRHIPKCNSRPKK